MVTKDAFVLSGSCTQHLFHLFHCKFCFKACQVLEPSSSSNRNKALPTAGEDWVSENLGPLEPTGWMWRHWGSWLMALWDHTTASLLHHHHQSSSVTALQLKHPDWGLSCCPQQPASRQPALWGKLLFLFTQRLWDRVWRMSFLFVLPLTRALQQFQWKVTELVWGLEHRTSKESSGNMVSPNLRREKVKKRSHCI